MATSRKPGAELKCGRNWWHHLRSSLKKTMIACVYFSKHLYFRYFCIFPSQIGGAKWHWTFKKKTQPNLSLKSEWLSLGMEKWTQLVCWECPKVLKRSWQGWIPPVGYAGGILHMSPCPRTKCPYRPLLHLLSTLDRQYGNWRGGVYDLCDWESCFGNR